jgi:hypothetical protein
VALLIGPNLHNPCQRKRNLSLPKGIPSNAKKVLDKDKRKLKLVEE